MNAETFRVRQVVKELGMKEKTLPFTQFDHSMEILLRKLRFRLRKWKNAYVLTYAEVRDWTISVKYSEGSSTVRIGQGFMPKGLASL